MSINDIDKFLPTSAKEMAARGWDYVDVIIFTGDAYVDHPSFGAAVIGRVLENQGLRVAIVPQPNWRDDLRDFRKLGRPRLFFGVTAGAMDSMVNHYTATRRLRSDDAYTPDNKAGMRPDYPTIVYTKILKNLYPDVPVVLGGIEASLRRLTHYDYWKNELTPSILIDSGADVIVYGNGEKAITELAAKLAKGEDWRVLKQIAYLADSKPDNAITLNSYEECTRSKKAYGENFVKFETESNKLTQSVLAEPIGEKFVVVNPAHSILSSKELDSVFDLPYMRMPHPRYRDKHLAGYEMIKHSVTLHRGCYGGCSFCAISAHQGKFISSRSKESVIAEVQRITAMSDFRGNLSDVGGPSANMWGSGGADREKCAKCSRPSCLFPRKCLNLRADHSQLLKRYSLITSVKGVKKAYVGSGIRYDMFDDDEYLRQIVKNHTSGRLKVAPEHTESHILALMRKPSYDLFVKLEESFKRICTAESLNYQLVPYFISAHPGCTESDMKALGRKVKNFRLEQVQDFTPTPMTLATAMYYLGFNPYDGKAIYSAKSKDEKDKQKSYFFDNQWLNQQQKPKKIGKKLPTRSRR